MAENQAQEPVVVVISNEHPTTKQQLTTAAIQIGSALALPVVIVVGLSTVSVVGKLKSKMKRDKTPAFPDSTDELPSNEE